MKKTICLNMIVKNECHVIQRCVESLRRLIDYWVIVDTGSTDGTQEEVQRILKDIPGELYERPWVGFAHNRNEAMVLAKGKADYLLLIDADDRLIFSQDFIMPELKADLYQIIQRDSNGETFRDHYTYFLLKSNEDFRWVGIIHERLISQTPKKVQKIEGVFNEYLNDGNRSKDPEKYIRDMALLKKGIQEEPGHAIYYFHLGRLYWNMGDFLNARECFKKRAQMGGDPTEVYYSLFYVGIMERHMKLDVREMIKTFTVAYLNRPSRSESIFELSRLYVEIGDHFLGFILADYAMQIPRPTDTSFLETWIYEWGAALNVFICAMRIGQVEKAVYAAEILLKSKEFPQKLRKEFEVDMWYEKLKRNRK